jgi:hypothetical protein
VCTAVLAQHARHVIGCDNSGELVKEARRRWGGWRSELLPGRRSQPAWRLLCGGWRGLALLLPSPRPRPARATPPPARPPARRHPGLQFELLDVLQSPGKLATLAAGCNVVFADIGGNRAAPALVQMLPVLLAVLRPRLMVVKSGRRGAWHLVLLLGLGARCIAADGRQQRLGWRSRLTQPPPAAARRYRR